MRASTPGLEWAAATGPVKLEIYKDGKGAETKFWHEHSADSIRAAMTYARGLVVEAVAVPS